MFILRFSRDESAKVGSEGSNPVHASNTRGHDYNCSRQNVVRSQPSLRLSRMGNNSIIVQKYGGACLETPAKIGAVERRSRRFAVSGTPDIRLSANSGAIATPAEGLELTSACQDQPVRPRELHFQIVVVECNLSLACQIDQG